MADVSRFAAYEFGEDTPEGDVSRFAVYEMGLAPPDPIPPDREAGVHVEAWDIANTTRKIASVPFVIGGLDIQQNRKPPGDGSITIPASFARLDEIFDPLGVEQGPILVASGAWSGNSENGETRTITPFDSGAQTGDLLVVQRAIYGTHTFPSDLNVIASTSNRVYWKLLVAGDEFEITIDSSTMWGIGWSLWRGHDGQAPELIHTDSSGSGNQNINPTSYSTTREFPTYLALSSATRGINHNPRPNPPYNEVVGSNFPTSDNGSLCSAYSDGANLQFDSTAYNTTYVFAMGGNDGPSRSLLKVYSDSLFRYGIIPERINRKYGESNQTVSLTGRGQESMASWAPLPGPAWNYGYDAEYFQNFTDPPELLTNGGYTEPLEGAFGDPTPGWSAKGGASHTPCTGCTTGLYGNVISVNATGTHTGIQQTVDVQGGQRYLLQSWIEGDVNNQRITMGMNFNGEAASGATVHQFTSSDFIYPSGSDNLLFELENANYANNGGCPGGATDGTVQLTVADVTVPADCEKVTVFIQYDTHPGCVTQPSNDTFYVHGVTMTGIGAGMPDEFDYDVYEPTKWDTDGDPVISGDYSWAWTPEDTNLKRTLVGPIDAETDEEFFASYKVGPPDASAEYRLVVYGNDATTIIADTGFVSATAGGLSAIAVRSISQAFTGPGSGQIYLGIVVQGTTGEYTFDEVAVFGGRAPASPGQIIGDMLTAVQADGYLTFLTTDFTASGDSNGELWRSTSIAADFGYGGTLKAALDRMATMGYEWALEPENVRFGYDTGWVLRLFNGYEAP